MCVLLIEVIDNIYKHLDGQEFLIGIYFDLQKAFNTVDHAILLDKLHIYGIRGNVHRWFKSNIEGRQQYTSIDKHCSNMSFVKCFIPQGSVHGPILFLIYVNDIHFSVTDAKIKLLSVNKCFFFFFYSSQSRQSLQILTYVTRGTKLSSLFCLCLV